MRVMRDTRRIRPQARPRALLAGAACALLLCAPAADSYRGAPPLAPRAGLVARATAVRATPRLELPDASVVASVASAANVVSGVGALTLVVAVHELGHFSAAVAQGIRVREFSIGFGPRVALLSPPNASFDVVLRALPLGGFVAFPRAYTPEMRAEFEASQERRVSREKERASAAGNGRAIGGEEEENGGSIWRALFAAFSPPPPPPPPPPLTGFAALFQGARAPSPPAQPQPSLPRGAGRAGRGARAPKGGRQAAAPGADGFQLPPPVSRAAAWASATVAATVSGLAEAGAEAEAESDRILAAELAASPDPDDPDLLQNRPLAQQALVIGAGVAANAVLAWAILLATVASTGLSVTDYRPEPAITNVVRASPAEAAGLRAGDLLVSIGGQPLPAQPEAAIDRALAGIRQGIEARQPVEVEVLRGAAPPELLARLAAQQPGAPPPAPASAPAVARVSAAPPPAAAATLAKQPTRFGGAPPSGAVPTAAATPAGRPALQRLRLTVVPPSGGGRVGLQLDKAPIRTTRTRAATPLEAVRQATVKTALIAQLVGSELLRALGTAASSLLGSAGVGVGGGGGGKGAGPSLQGPIGLITSAVAMAGSGDPQLFALFIATISLNVAVFNTLPVPGLDGGQMAFIAVDALAESLGQPRLDRKVKEGVGVVFALALTGLALSVLLSDVERVIEGMLRR